MPSSHSSDTIAHPARLAVVLLLMLLLMLLLARKVLWLTYLMRAEEWRR